ncbi:hypothetical protein SLEP1_g44337 [Rubroshorea leprosula]|uniref:Uncharacterized protein n=1 Tax=Rubroshorea leprosula TaxID=152421 RepID=A0AAV5LHR8_9ROSI|nr:hypothetical protein SLEP1_g44337 [Rubroshorea leprosula]
MFSYTARALPLTAYPLFVSNTPKGCHASAMLTMRLLYDYEVTV